MTNPNRPADLKLMYENQMVRLQCTDDGRYFVDGPEGFATELDDEEAEYLSGVMSSAVHHGLPARGDFDFVGEYLFQCCLAVMTRGRETWQLFFRTVPAPEMGRMIADECLQNEGKRH